MKFTDKTAERIFKSIKCIEVKESIESYPEDERDDKTDLDIIRDEVEYFVYMFEEVDGAFKDDLERSRAILRETNNGKCNKIILPEFKLKYSDYQIKAAKQTVSEYRQLKRILTKI